MKQLDCKIWGSGMKFKLYTELGIHQTAAMGMTKSIGEPLCKLASKEELKQDFVKY